MRRLSHVMARIYPDHRALQSRPRNHLLGRSLQALLPSPPRRKLSFNRKSTSQSLTSFRPSSSPTTVPSQFLIKYQAGPNEGPSRVHRSEMIVEGYLTANGKGVQDCRTASIFRLSDSYILSTGENGEIYSTESGVLSAPLAASDAIHSIYGIWEMSGDVLRWDNALFSSGTASFCMDGSYSITAYFLVPIPSNCISLEFGILPCKSSCIFQW